MSILTEYKGKQVDGVWSPAIWGNCDIEDYKARGGALIFEDDFDSFYTDGNRYQLVGDTASDIHLATTDVGRGNALEFEHDTSTDNDELYVELGSGTGGADIGFPFVAGAKTWFEAMLEASTVTDDALGIAIILGEPGIGVANMLTDNDADLVDKDYVGVNVKNDDSDSLDFVFNTASGGGETIHGTKAIAVDTVYSIGMYCDGTTVWFYFNGTKVDEDGVALTATNFPNGEYLVPAAGYKMGTGSGSGSLFLHGWRAVCTKAGVS